MTAVQVDDRQAAHAEGDTAIHQHARIVRTTVRHGIAHSLQSRPWGERTVPDGHETGDTAHQ